MRALGGLYGRTLKRAPYKLLVVLPAALGVNTKLNPKDHWTYTQQSNECFKEKEREIARGGHLLSRIGAKSPHALAPLVCCYFTHSCVGLWWPRDEVKTNTKSRRKRANVQVKAHVGGGVGERDRERASKVQGGAGSSCEERTNSQ